MIYILILLFLLLVIIGLFLSAAVLFWMTKLFRVTNFLFKDSLKITLWVGLLGFFINVIFSVINLGIISSILMTVVTFFVFYYFLKKYQVSWKKSLGIYVSFGIVLTILSLMIITPVRSLVMQPFYVKGGAMEPNINDNDYLIINMMDKSFERGNIVIFRYPKDQNQYFIKRVIGLPGDKVQIKDKFVFINDNKLDESYLGINTETNLPVDGFGDLTLTNGQYFLLGDNRDKSLDSRIFGPVDVSLFVGKIWFRGSPKFGEIK